MTGQEILVAIVSTRGPVTFPQALNRFLPFYFRNEERAKQVMDTLKKDLKLWWDYLLIPYQGGLITYFPVLEEEADCESQDYCLESVSRLTYDRSERVIYKLQIAGVTIHNPPYWGKEEEEMVSNSLQRLYAEKGIL